MCPYTSRMFKVKIERSDSCVISEGVDEVVHSSGAFRARENLDLGANCLFRFVARGGLQPLGFYLLAIYIKFVHGNVGPG